MLHKIVESYSDVLSAIWQKNSDMRNVGFSFGIRGITNAVFFFSCYIASQNIVLSIAAMALSSTLTLLLFDFVVSKKYINQFESIKKSKKGQVKALLLTGSLMMFFVFFTSLINSIPRLIIEKKCGVDLLGVYASVFAPTIVISTFAIGVNMPLLPRITKNYNEKNMAKIFKTITVCETLFVIGGIAAEVLALFVGKELFKLIFGSEILAYFDLFYNVIVVSVLIAMVNCYSAVLIAIRKLKQLLLFSVAACAIVLVLSLLLIDGYGIYGAAYAMIITLLIQFVFETAYVVGVIQKQCKP